MGTWSELVRKLRGKDRRQPAPRQRQTVKGQGRKTLLRWGLIGSEILVLAFLFPREKVYNLSQFREGMISKERIVADIGFPVRKSEDHLSEEQQEARRRVPPVLNFAEDIGRSKVTALDSLFDQILQVSQMRGMSDSLKVVRLRRRNLLVFDETIAFLLSLAAERNARNRTTFGRLREICRDGLRDAYAEGVLGDQEAVEEEAPGTVHLVKNGREEAIPLAEIRDLPMMRQRMTDLIGRRLAERGLDTDQTIKASREVALAFLIPNIAFDRITTERRREDAEGEVAPIKGYVFENEKIIDANERITPEHLEKLHSYFGEKLRIELAQNPWGRHLLRIEQILITAFLVLVFLEYLRVFEQEVYRNLSLLSLFAILLILPVMVASLLASHSGFSPFLVPVALSSMLATILFNARVGLVLTFVISLFVGYVFNYDFQIVLVCALSGSVAAYSVIQVRHRRQFYRAMGYIPLAYAASITLTGALRFLPIEKILGDVGPGILIGFFSPVLTMGLLPIFESVFDITTDITLLELSDLNQPLLRDLAIQAPGTYSHSIVLANMAEAAAEAIRADPLLARVGCYYHDIGKMRRPKHFIENLMEGERNPHDKLTPSMSALILAEHVKYGAEHAETRGLPKAVVDIIQQHHGTSTMVSFYNKALEQRGENQIDEKDFKYPGPRPQTKVAGIISLADAVEAATRALRERAPGRLKGRVQRIIRDRFSASELDECDLTLKDLHDIEESFLPVLMGTMHGRPEYPKVPV